MSRILAITLVLFVASLAAPALTPSTLAQDYGYSGGYSSGSAGCDTINCGVRRTSGSGNWMSIAGGEPFIADGFNFPGYDVYNSPCYTRSAPSYGSARSSAVYPYLAETYQYSECRWYRPLPNGSQVGNYTQYQYPGYTRYDDYRSNRYYDNQPVTCYNRYGRQVSC